MEFEASSIGTLHFPLTMTSVRYDVVPELPALFVPLDTALLLTNVE